MANNQWSPPLTDNKWSADEWKAAEAVVFDMRSHYKPDSLSAIYKDIAINLQCQITSSPPPTIGSEGGFEEWDKAIGCTFAHSGYEGRRAAWNAALAKAAQATPEAKDGPSSD